MSTISTSIIIIVLLSSSACLTPPKKLTVDEWNQGIPIGDADPMIQYSKKHQARFTDIQIVDLGKSEYAHHPKTGKTYYTVDKTGTHVQSVVTTDNKINHYYSMASFKPVVLEVVPEAAEKFSNAEKFEKWADYVLKFGLATLGAGVIAGPVGAALITYVFPASSVVAGALTGASTAEYQAIKNTYDLKINQRKSSEKIVIEGAKEASP